MNTSEVIESQLRQLFANVVWTHKIQEKQADMYRKKYNIFETTKIILSSITSVGIISVIFTDELWIKIVSAVISLICTFINSYYKAYDLSGLAESFKQSALEFLKIREELITLLCDIKLKKMNDEELLKKRDDIINKLMSLYSSTKDASESAVKNATYCLKGRGDNTYSDEEIDSYLPIFLRRHNGDNNEHI